MKYKFTKEQLEDAVAQSYSIAGVCRILGIRAVGGNYKTVRTKLAQFGISTEHFTGKGWNIGLKFKPSTPKDLSLLLVENSTCMSSVHLLYF